MGTAGIKGDINQVFQRKRENKIMQHNEAYWKMRRKMVKDLGDRIDEMQAEKESTETVVKPEIIKHFQ